MSVFLKHERKLGYISHERFNAKKGELKGGTCKSIKNVAVRRGGKNIKSLFCPYRSSGVYSN